eukprot:3932197-Rhodomonas_salina.2
MWFAPACCRHGSRPSDRQIMSAITITPLSSSFVHRRVVDLVIAHSSSGSRQCSRAHASSSCSISGWGWPVQSSTWIRLSARDSIAHIHSPLDFWCGKMMVVALAWSVIRRPSSLDCSVSMPATHIAVPGLGLRCPYPYPRLPVQSDRSRPITCSGMM